MVSKTTPLISCAGACQCSESRPAPRIGVRFSQQHWRYCTRFLKVGLGRQACRAHQFRPALLFLGGASLVQQRVLPEHGPVTHGFECLFLHVQMARRTTASAAGLTLPQG